MALLEWNDTFDLGVEELDDDHRLLVDYVNQANDLVVGDPDNTRLKSLLDDFIAHLERHFAREEAIFEKCREQGHGESHGDASRKALGAFENIRDQIAGGDRDVDARAIVEYLHRWLIDHVIVQNFNMKPDLVGAGLSRKAGIDGSPVEALMDRFSINARITAIAFVPLLTMLIFATVGVIGSYREKQEYEAISSLAKAAGPVSGLVHELQKERGASAGFLGGGGSESFRGKMLEQRRNTDGKTDVALAALEKIKGIGLEKKVVKALELFGQVSDIRTKVNGQKLSVAEEVAFYSNLNASLIAVIADMSKIASDAEFANAIGAYVGVLQGKERAGIERAVGSAGFGGGRFPLPLYRKFVTLIAEQKTYTNLFKAMATPEALTFFGKTVSGPDMDQIETWRAIALNSLETGNTGGVKGTDWFDTMTSKINKLKALEDFMSKSLIERAERASSRSFSVFIQLLVVSTVVAALVVALAVILIGGIVKPLVALRHSLDRLAGGDTTVDVFGLHKRDDIGDIARSVQSFKEGIINKNMDQAAQAIEDDGRRRLAGRRLALVREFKTDVAGFMERLGKATNDMASHAAAMAGSSNDNKESAEASDTLANEATDHVQAVAAATEELSSSVMEISRQTVHSTEIAASAKTAASGAHQTIQSLSEATERIGAVVNLITDIAKQTNLLALNATIEASRAGEAGKGFAVVATEVKNLAGQTGKATDEIAAQISSVQTETAQAVSAIDQVAATIEEMSSVTSTVASAVEEQGAATQEIGQSVESAADRTKSVSDRVHMISRSAATLENQSQEVKASAGILNEEAAALNEKVREFLEGMRIEE